MIELAKKKIDMIEMKAFMVFLICMCALTLSSTDSLSLTLETIIDLTNSRFMENI